MGLNENIDKVELELYAAAKPLTLKEIVKRSELPTMTVLAILKCGRQFEKVELPGRPTKEGKRYGWMLLLEPNRGVER